MKIKLCQVSGLLFINRYGIDRLINEMNVTEANDMVMTKRIQLPCEHSQVVTKAHLSCAVITCQKCKKIIKLTAKLKRKIADELEVENWKNNSPMR